MDAAPDTGLFASLRRMLATLLGLIHTRLELVGVEIEEQIAHATSVLLWSIAAIFFASLTVLLLAFTVLTVWTGHMNLGAVNLPLFLLEGVAILAEVFALLVLLLQGSH